MADSARVLDFALVRMRGSRTLALPFSAHGAGPPSSSPGNPYNPGSARLDALNRSWCAQGPRLAMYDSARVLDPALVRTHVGSKQAAGLPSPSVGEPAGSDAADGAAAPVSRLGAGLPPPPAGLGPGPLPGPGAERMQQGAGGALPLEGLGRGVEPQVERLTPHDSAGAIEAGRERPSLACPQVKNGLLCHGQVQRNSELWLD